MDLMTDGQILVLIMCAVFAFLAYKFRQPALSLIAGAAMFVLSVQLYDPDSPDLLLLAMLISMAIIQFVLVLSVSLKRR